MKKSVIFILLMLSVISGFAQYNVYPTVPLYGIASNQDRTYRALQLGQAVLTYTTVATTPDTVTFVPGFVAGAGAVFHKDYYITVADTTVFAIRDVSSSYIGSTITMFLIGTNANCLIRFLGSQYIPTSQWNLAAGATTILLTASHYLAITFQSTGTKWVELYRSQD